MKQETNTKSIVCIGGGTGTFVVLRGLKHFPYQLKAIVAMSDSGGSNKRIRDEFGLLPTSDLRQCLVALSEEKGGAGLLRKLFMYRFDKGTGLSGMTFGNLFMAALSDILGSQQEAIRQSGKVLRIRGTVIPVTFTDTNLHAEYENGKLVKDEHNIDEPKHDGTIKIRRIFLEPRAVANPEAIEAIAAADMVVIGPGDLFTSILPNLIVSGISDALKQTHAKIVFVMNLMTKYGQTYNFSAKDHMNVIESYIGNIIDYILINNGKLNETALRVYAKYRETPVQDDLSAAKPQIIRTDLTSGEFVSKDKSDRLVRSLIRHDSMKLAYALDHVMKNLV